jgi:hypothetical protein
MSQQQQSWPTAPTPNQIGNYASNTSSRNPRAEDTELKIQTGYYTPLCPSKAITDAYGVNSQGDKKS